MTGTRLRYAAALLMCTWLGVGLAAATLTQDRSAVPDSTRCTVQPWDTYGKAFVSPGDQTGVDALTVIVLDAAGTPIPNAIVEIQLSTCGNLCVDSPVDGLDGLTNAMGRVVLNPRVGGCQTCPVLVKANGVTIRTFGQVASPDAWPVANGSVGLSDWTSFFSQYVTGIPTPCTDFNGDGALNTADSLLFVNAWLNANSGPCTLPPDPASCTVSPWDGFTIQKALVSPGDQSNLDEVTITVRDVLGTPLPGVPVQLVLDACSQLCIDSPDDGLTGTTNASGQVVLNPRAGGCEACPVLLRAGSVTLRTYPSVSGPDWDGQWADGKVDTLDAVYFASVLMTTDDCADYDGDGWVTAADYSRFASSYLAQDANDQLCPLPVDSALCSVEPWDTYGKAFVSPGDQSGSDTVAVTVYDDFGRPLWNGPVEIDVTDCSNLCVDTPVDGLRGFTDAAGLVVLDPRVGGCDSCAVLVKANGSTIRKYNRIASPDWDGSWADGRVDFADSSFFYTALGSTGPCGDYDGNGTVGLSDLLIFVSTLNTDINTTLCQLPPDSANCSVLPWDTYGKLFVSPGSASNADLTTATVRDRWGHPIKGVVVDVDLTSCTKLCVDYPVDGLTELTNPAGLAVLNPRVGGCDSCAIVVTADGVPIRTYDRVASPDWTGAADGRVNASDVVFFISNYTTGEVCADYDGSGTVGSADSVLFVTAYGDVNTLPCPGPPSPGNCSILPWDTYGKALVSPGSQSGVDVISVVVRDVRNIPVPGVPVVIDLSSCPTLCVDSVTDGLSGVSGAGGVAVLDPHVGGCEACPVSVRAGAVPIRSYTQVASPDMDASGAVLLADATLWFATWGSSNPCGDFDGSGLVTSPDSVIFAAAYTARDANDGPCTSADVGDQPADGRPATPQIASATLVPRLPGEIRFSLPRPTRVTLRLFDVTGALVATMADGAYPDGESRVSWDGRGTNGKPLAPGAYFLKLTTPQGEVARKLILLRSAGGR
jgi:hypothetical protein